MICTHHIHVLHLKLQMQSVCYRCSWAGPFSVFFFQLVCTYTHTHTPPMAYWQWMDHSKLDRLNLHNTHTQIWTHFKSSTTHSKCSLNPFWTYVVASASRTEQGCTYTTSTQEFRTTISSVSFSLPASQSILIISQPEDIHHEFSFRRGRCQILDDKLKY